jgi:hypothetical protein
VLPYSSLTVGACFFLRSITSTEDGSRRKNPATCARLPKCCFDISRVDSGSQKGFVCVAPLEAVAIRVY